MPQMDFHWLGDELRIVLTALIISSLEEKGNILVKSLPPPQSEKRPGVQREESKREWSRRRTLSSSLQAGCPPAGLTGALPASEGKQRRASGTRVCLGLQRSTWVQTSAVCVSAPPLTPFGVLKGQVFPEGRAVPRRSPTAEPFLPLNESSGNRLEGCQEGLG